MPKQSDRTNKQTEEQSNNNNNARERIKKQLNRKNEIFIFLCEVALPLSLSHSSSLSSFWSLWMDVCWWCCGKEWTVLPLINAHRMNSITFDEWWRRQQQLEIRKERQNTDWLQDRSTFSKSLANPSIIITSSGEDDIVCVVSFSLLL